MPDIRGILDTLVGRRQWGSRYAPDDRLCVQVDDSPMTEDELAQVEFWNRTLDDGSRVFVVMRRLIGEVRRLKGAKT